jgi:hypothetical protein
MKTGPNALGTAENDSGRVKHENGTRRPRYRRKHVRYRKMGPDAHGTAENEFGSKNMKTGPDALSTARRNYVWERKTWKRDSTPSIPPKMSTGARNMKTGPDAPRTAENESGSAKS